MTIGLGSRPSQVPIRSRPIRQLRFSSRTSPESPTSCYSISRHSSHRKQMDLAIDSIVYNFGCIEGEEGVTLRGRRGAALKGRRGLH